MKNRKHKRYRGFLDDLWNSFPTSYITLISIIQSALVGFLLFVVENESHIFKPINWLLTAITFLVIVIVWNEYRMGATMFFWVPTLRDTLIPFALCIAQFLVTRNIVAPKMWFGSMAAFWILGAVAYFNMYYSAIKEGEQNDEMLSVIGEYHRWNPIIAFIGATIFSVIAWISNDNLKLDSLNTILGVLSLLLIIIFLWRGELYWGRVARFAREEFAKGM